MSTHKFLDSLLSTDLLTESVKADLQKGIAQMLEEAKSAAEESVREEMGKAYQLDMSRLIEAMDTKITEGVEMHAKKLVAEQARARRVTAKAAKAITEAKARAEAKMNVVLEKMLKRMDERLTAELKPIYEDREVERAANIRKLKEMEIRDDQRRERLVNEGAKMLETFIDQKLGSFIQNIKSDLEYARQNDFGRKIYEAFSDVFEHDFHQRDNAIAKLSKSLKEAKGELATVKKAASTKIKKLSEAVKTESAAKRKIMEKAQRAQTIDQLLAPLKGDARSQMRVILESSPTDKLESTFKKYRKVIIESKQPTNRKEKRSTRGLSEATLETGRSAAIFESEDNDVTDLDIARLRRLAL